MDVRMAQEVEDSTESSEDEIGVQRGMERRGSVKTISTSQGDEGSWRLPEGGSLLQERLRIAKVHHADNLRRHSVHETAMQDLENLQQFSIPNDPDGFRTDLKMLAGTGEGTRLPEGCIVKPIP